MNSGIKVSGILVGLCISFVHLVFFTKKFTELFFKSASQSLGGGGLLTGSVLCLNVKENNMGDLVYEVVCHWERCENSKPLPIPT